MYDPLEPNRGVTKGEWILLASCVITVILLLVAIFHYGPQLPN